MEYPFLAITTRSTLAGVVAPDRVLSMDQIVLFEVLSWIELLEIEIFWPLNYVKTNGWCLIELFLIFHHKNYILRMLRAILNKSWRQHPTRHQLYGHLPPITETIQLRRTRHAGNCWRSRDEPISDVLLWTTTYVRAKAGRPARTCIQQLCEDTECGSEDLPEAMNDREKWRERDMMMMMMRMMT